MAHFVRDLQSSVILFPAFQLTHAPTHTRLGGGSRLRGPERGENVKALRFRLASNHIGISWGGSLGSNS